LRSRAARPHGALAVIEKALELGARQAPGPAQGDVARGAVQDVKGRVPLDRQSADEVGVLRVLTVDGEPGEPPGMLRQRRVAEDRGADEAAGVSPGGPGFDEDRNTAGLRVGQGAGGVVGDER